MPDEFSRGACTREKHSRRGKTHRKLYGHHFAASAAFPGLVKNNGLHRYWSGTLNMLSGASGNCACVTVNSVFLR